MSNLYEGAEPASPSSIEQAEDYPVEYSSASCPSGYESDGYGNCVSVE